MLTYLGILKEELKDEVASVQHENLLLLFSLLVGYGEGKGAELGELLWLLDQPCYSGTLS